MMILGIDHVNIGAIDMAASERFFCEILGLEKGHRPDFPFPGSWLYAGGRAIVHLVELSTARGASNQSALDHFAFRITDYDGVLSRLKNADVAFRELNVPGTPIRQIFVRDPNGVAIELNYSGPEAPLQSPT